MAGRFDLAVKFIHDVQSELQHDISERKVRPQPFASLVENVGNLSAALLGNKQHPNEIGANEIYHEAVRVAMMALRLATEGDAAFPYDPAEVTANVD